ncbi:MAG: Flp pilus assembly pilin Flp [Yoonia sp.]|jgi:Flp pilus assembly pilin Flp
MNFDIKHFLRDETGAVSVDWVVLTAGIVILAGAVAIGIRDETKLAGDRITAKVETHITE